MRTCLPVSDDYYCANGIRQYRQIVLVKESAQESGEEFAILLIRL